jgi:UDP-N-acetylglucosamine 2-epimerase (non-hydrolysing)
VGVARGIGAATLDTHKLNMPNQLPDETRAHKPVLVPNMPNFGAGRTRSVLTLFGTRPEVIKLAPVMRQLERERGFIRTLNVTSGQHSDLLYSFIEMFGIRVDFDLRLMTHNQDPATLCGLVRAGLEKVVKADRPSLILVQGDTTTALAGALFGNEHGIPVAHVEAGLRSGNVLSPCPEEMNRRHITRLATYHFAATTRNREALLQEGIRDENIFTTGNPVVDALQMVLQSAAPLPSSLLAEIEGRKCIVLTTHRRESFGDRLTENLKVLRQFVQEHADVVLLFPVHPNPNVHSAARPIFADAERIALIAPLPYGDFIQLLARSWLIVSDSGGIQEEVPSLGKPLLILRENTERPECIESGLARLVGGNPKVLMEMLEEAYADNSWVNSVHKVPNPFGKGQSAERIVSCVVELLKQMHSTVERREWSAFFKSS